MSNAEQSTETKVRSAEPNRHLTTDYVPYSSLNAYDNISVGGSAAAIFGNVDQSIHYHYSRKRSHVEEDESPVSKRSKGKQPDGLSQLIESLSFDGMWQRHENIVAAYPGTCEWILSDRDPNIDGQSTGQNPQDHDKSEFGKWLESDENYFWIRGVAGSGKSTLVSFITTHEADIKTRLRRWADDEHVIFASFFFWRHGKFLQKSINGMMRTLLVQILQQAPQTYSKLISEGCSPLLQYESMADLQHNRAWSQAHLSELLRRTIQICNSRICFLIDALDEFHGYEGQDQLNPHEAALGESVSHLLKAIEDLWNMPNVKVCVASRPGNVFEVAFGDTKVLNLEDLNQEDITTYVEGKLGRFMTTNTARNILRVLLERSQGIFLWIKLAVDSLLEGIANGDGLEDLEGRLDELPVGLDNMYGHMMLQLDRRYLDDAALLFSLVDYFHDESYRDERDVGALLVFCCREFVMHPSRQHQQRLSHHKFSKDSMEKIMRSRTCGLLLIGELQDISLHPFREVTPPQEFRSLCTLSTTYIHRTAKEFMLANATKCGIKLNKLSDQSSNSLEALQWGIVRGVLQLLRTLYCSTAEGMLDETLVEAAFGRSDFIDIGWNLYSFAVRALARLERSSRIAAWTHLDQLGEIPFLIDNPTMLERCGFLNPSPMSGIDQRILPLSHLAFCTVHGLTDYTLSRICSYMPGHAYEIAYLLYFSLCWLIGHQQANSRMMPGYVNVPELNQCIDRLLKMLTVLDVGNAYIRNLWAVCLTHHAYWVPNFTRNHGLLMKQYCRTPLPPSSEIKCWLNQEMTIQAYHETWTVLLSPAVLLFPISGYPEHNEQDVQIFEELVIRPCWPLGARIIHAHVPCLLLDFPIDVGQSDFVLENCFSMKRPYIDFGTNEQHKRLVLVLAYNLAKLSGTLSEELTWCQYAERARPSSRVCRYPTWLKKPCERGQCSGCCCMRAVCTKWLRKVLREHELDWDSWFDILLERYGRRDQTLWEAEQTRKESWRQQYKRIKLAAAVAS